MLPPQSPTAELRVDGPRLLRRLAELRSVGGDADGGVTRLAFSAADVVARSLLTRWMGEAGLQVSTDAATNLIGRTTAGPGALVSGSHLDTVVRGGWLDGAYGVVAAVEVAQTLHEAGVSLRHPYAAIAFANEEGANGTVSFTGSTAIIGGAIDLAATDDEGVALADRLRTAGGNPDALQDAAWSPGALAAMIELHIEQGPVLEHHELSIGVVESITARTNVTVHVRGRSNHAGTTPMELRADASVAVAHLVLAVQQLALDGLVRVATCGYVRVAPNVRNVVPGTAELGLDLRDADPERVRRAIAALTVTAQEVAERTGTVIELSATSSVQGAPCHPLLVDCVQQAADSLGLSTLRMPSGAGHDAQVIAEIAPVGMVFVPSRGGVSHHPGEDTFPEDLVHGADVLLRAILTADQRLQEPTP